MSEIRLLLSIGHLNFLAPTTAGSVHPTTFINYKTCSLEPRIPFGHKDDTFLHVHEGKRELD